MKLVTLEFLVKSTTLTNVSWSRSRLKNKSYLKCGLRMSEEASRCFFASLITHITQYYHQILRVHYRNGLKDDSAISSVLKLLTRCKVQGGCQWKIDNFDSCLSSEAEHERKPKNTYLKIGWVLTEMRYLHNRNALPPEAADLLSLKCDRGLFLDLGFLFCVPLVHRAHCLPSCLLNEIFSNHLIIVPNPQLPAWPILLPAFFFFLSQLRVTKNLRFQPDLQA